MACCWNGWSSTTSTERSIAVRSPFFSNLNTGERANSFSMTRAHRRLMTSGPHDASTSASARSSSS